MASLGAAVPALMEQDQPGLSADAQRAAADAARLVLAPEDVKILSGTGGEGGTRVDRIGMLGEWDIVLQVRGGEEIKRTVRVLPQAADVEGEDAEAVGVNADSPNTVG